MTHNEDWVADGPPRGWFSRLLAPDVTATKPATGAFIAAALGAVAFVASMTMAWQSAVVPLHLDSSERAPSTMTYTTGPTSADFAGLAYVVGMLVLLALAGAVISRSDLAVRARFAASGLAAGLIGAVLAKTAGLRWLLIAQYGPVVSAPDVDLHITYESGLPFAVTAVVATTASIWLGGRPAVRIRDYRPVEVAAEEEPEADEFALPAATSRWVVRTSEDLDLTVTPER